ncbi:MAG: stage V sporulation T C-terminal domain-containing protein [Hominenteromicrobium sp.]
MTQADDLGRVVIPKEIRRTMKISEGTPLEIFIDKDGGIIFRKYSPIGELSESAQHMSECVSALCGAGVAVSDRDHIVASAGIPKKDLLDKPVSKQLEELMRRKMPFVSSGEDTVLAADGGLRTANAAFPILSAGDICGMFMLIKDEKAHPGESEENLRLARLAAAFLGRETAE